MLEYNSVKKEEKDRQRVEAEEERRERQEAEERENNVKLIEIVVLRFC